MTEEHIHANSDRGRHDPRQTPSPKAWERTISLECGATELYIVQDMPPAATDHIQ